jgi:hypothetical protein
LRVETLILDTNLLVLFVVGTASRGYISSHKRLTEFVPQDYDCLLEIISRAKTVLVTPNTLSETSNLAAYIAEPAKGKVMSVLGKLIADSQELYVKSSEAAATQEFVRLGLTDAALICAGEGDAVVLTTDLDLHSAVLARGKESVNFNHLRDQYL